MNAPLFHKQDVTIHLSAPAFRSIVLTAINSYPRECLGLLVGVQESVSLNFRVQESVPIVSVKARYSWVEPSMPGFERVKDALPKLNPGCITVGDFHSHPSRGKYGLDSYPSDEDVEEFSSGLVHVIVAIRKQTRPSPWRITHHGGISGTVHGFAFELAAYRIRDPVSKSWNTVRLNCPHATGLGLLD